MLWQDPNKFLFPKRNKLWRINILGQVKNNTSAQGTNILEESKIWGIRRKLRKFLIPSVTSLITFFDKSVTSLILDLPFLFQVNVHHSNTEHFSGSPSLW
jgi:hypothetical protein